MARRAPDRGGVARGGRSPSGGPPISRLAAAVATSRAYVSLGNAHQRSRSAAATACAPSPSVRRRADGVVARGGGAPRRVAAPAARCGGARGAPRPRPETHVELLQEEAGMARVGAARAPHQRRRPRRRAGPRAEAGRASAEDAAARARHQGPGRGVRAGAPGRARAPRARVPGLAVARPRLGQGAAPSAALQAAPRLLQPLPLESPLEARYDSLIPKRRATFPQSNVKVTQQHKPFAHFKRL